MHIDTARNALCFAAAAVVAVAMQPRFDIAAYRPAAAKTPYARPVEVGGFSRIDGELHFDKRALRRYRAPRLPDSLATGYSDFVPRRDDKDAAEECLLAAVERYEQTASANFVTYRNNLNKLLATLHCPNDDWCIGVRRLDGDNRWLLRVRDTPRRREEEGNQSDAQKLQSFFGYRFEALCTDSDPAKPIDANDEYVGMFNCKLGDHRLAVAAEIDCADDAGTYIELKTNKLLASKRLVGTFERFKMFKFWVQSHLVGTARVVVGFRDEDELQKVQAFDTLELPGLAAAGAQGRPSWRPQACLGFADAVLTWLRYSPQAADGEAFSITYDPDARAISFARDGADGPKRRRRD
jgi:RAT1-interacting protein